ncbi:proteoglycan 4-like isoform X1 [Drosophila miranda]|uniref:proteoglycan 4-like isoform X1 n=1 Tax=Drosophila miranda TaxID=7229 RepID=UPI00143F42EA|nr:proteoglycan 4-like isoform X1 [Drosophila miranda]
MGNPPKLMKAQKRTPKRRSFIERAQRESEELVRTMGGSLELEGGRRTRSSTRGTPTRAAETVTPPPNKKARASLTTATKIGGGGGAGKGRGARKLDVGSDELDREPEKTNDEEKVVLPVKAKATPKKDKKEVKREEKPVKGTPKKAVPATTTEPQKEEEPADAKETDAKTIENEDQTDGAAAKLTAVPEEQQNHAAEDKASKDEPEVKEKTPEEVPKAEDPPKSNDDPENGASTDTPAPAAAADPAPAAMEVDEEKPSAASADNKTKAESAPETTSEPPATTAADKAAEEPKKLSEPAREPSPEPMEVDSSSKSSTETVRFTPAEKVVASSEETKASNSVVDEVATEVKEDVPAEPKEEKKAECSDELKSTEEPKPAESAEEPKKAEQTTGEKATTAASVPAPVPATNDVSKTEPAAAVDTTVVSETPIKQAQAISAVNKSELNGETKIVNNSVDVDAAPKVCN